jgi:hypothetical protein
MRDDRWRCGRACPGFLSPFGRRPSLDGPPVPARELGLPYGRLTSDHQRSLDPDGVSVFRTREARPGRVPPLPRGGGVPTAAWSAATVTCRFPAASPAPRRNVPSPGPSVTRHQQRFTLVHPSGLSLACSPRMERVPLGMNPELQTPRLLATPVRAGTGTRTLARDHILNRSASNRCDPLNACDLTSHAPSEPCMPLVAAHGSSKPVVVARRSGGRDSALPALTVGVGQTESKRVRFAVDRGGDLLAADRLAGRG